MPANEPKARASTVDRAARDTALALANDLHAERIDKREFDRRFPRSDDAALEGFRAVLDAAWNEIWIRKISEGTEADAPDLRDLRRWALFLGTNLPYVLSPAPDHLRHLPLAIAGLLLLTCVGCPASISALEWFEWIRNPFRMAPDFEEVIALSVVAVGASVLGGWLLVRSVKNLLGDRRSRRRSWKSWMSQHDARFHPFRCAHDVIDAGGDPELLGSPWMCPNCGYDLSATPGTGCPECGLGR